MGIRAFFVRHFANCRRNHIMRRFTRKLDLDSAQASRLRDVHETLEALRRDAIEGWRYQRQALHGLFGREQFDRDEALRLAKVPMAMVNDALPHAVDRFAEFYDALSVDQRTRLRELLNHRCCGPHHRCAC